MRTKIILILAITMGIVTTVLFYNYMKKFNTEQQVIENVIEVLAAKQPIAKNQQITSDMVQLITVPQSEVYKEAFTNVVDVAGKVATADLAQGEPILKHRIQDQKEEALLVSRKVKEGFRAVSVGVNIVQTVTNLIEPEDEVDVYFSEPNKETKLMDTMVLLQKVKVLAVGRRMTDPDPNVPYMEYSAVTLELNAADTLKIINAKERGNVHLALHSKVNANKAADK
jgi:pilus assembly protein CpaB